MSMSFYFGTAGRNIINNKKQSLLYIFGIIITITIISSLSIWSSTSENLAVRDLLSKQNYEIKVRPIIPTDLPYIQEWLDRSPYIESTARIYYNLAFFNAESKNPRYRFWPLDNQSDMTDPVTLATLFLVPETRVERFAHQYEVEGEFELGVGDVLISKGHAEQIEHYLNITVVPGMKTNLSICRQSVDFGIFLFQYEPVNFYNITIRGIYDRVTSATMLQETFSDDFLDNSIFFLQENMLEDDVQRMDDNGLTPLLAAKIDLEVLSQEGTSGILTKIEEIIDLLKFDFPIIVAEILDSPINNLEQAYTKAKTVYLVMTPVVILGLIQTLITLNILLESRRTEITILKEKGGQKWQIIGSILIEFIILIFIALAFVIVASLFVASLLPSVASGSVTEASFVDFFSNMKFEPWSIVIASLSFLIITLLFTTLKINQIISINLEERDVKFRDKSQKIILYILLTVLTLGAITAFIVLTFILGTDLRNADIFTLEDSQNSSYLFITISIIVILVSVLLAVLLFLLIGRMKIIYNITHRRNSFFLVNNFSKSRYKLNIIFDVLLIITSSTFYSISLLKTISTTNENLNYYNNGSDFRIVTQEVNHTYDVILRAVEGIEDVMPVMRTSGFINTQSVTVYGINPESYITIGRWIDSSFRKDAIPDIYQNNTYENWLMLLSENINNSIISDSLPEIYQINISDIIIINNLPVGAIAGPDDFYVTGKIHSAPGLGLAIGKNLDLNQPQDHFMLVNEDKLVNHYGIETTELFFASLSSDFILEEVKEQLLLLEEVIAVNPVLQGEGFVDDAINNYIPSIEVFIIAQIAFINIIGIVIIFTNIDFILKQRKQETAILAAFGNTNTNYLKMVLSEIFLLDFWSIFIGLLISLPMVWVTVKVITPFFTNIMILPMQYSIDYVFSAVFIIIFLAVTALAAVPTLIRSKREKISIAIQDETSSAY
ncbi:MAG: ABC transporter permease [Candidatus Heimdallarchaeota archaeon]